MNQKKYVFGVTAENLLGFIITKRGIEEDLTKIKDILKMKPPKIKNEVGIFLGRIQFISRFISKLTTTCEPLLKILKREEKFD